MKNEDTQLAVGLLLELAASDDLESFKAHMDRSPALADESGPWYGRHTGSSQMSLHRLTPLMVAATFGSLDVLSLLLASSVDVNRHCGVDRATALHCAASGGSPRAPDAARALLAAGADPALTDASGRRPFDVVFAPPNSPSLRHALRTLLATETDDNKRDVLPSSSPWVPDVKNGMYTTDEFRMYSFKVRGCGRAYSHDWTECPFVHPGENARRRDPRKHHYSCVPCPEFRKGACRRGDACEYAHGVFECWLHPAQYRTRLCKDGPACLRRVCFFAHAPDQLRPLYISTGSAVPTTPRHTPPVSPGWTNPRIRFSDHPIISPMQHRFRSFSSKWGEPNGEAEWAVTGEELGRLRRSSSFEIANDDGEEEEEPDLSWVQSLVRETPQQGDGDHIEEQSILGKWLKQMQLDQLMAQ